jgi:hypothetical protein
MIGLGIEFGREPLDVFACDALFRALETHAENEIIEPLDHRLPPRDRKDTEFRNMIAWFVYGCKKRRKALRGAPVFLSLPVS